MILLEDTLEIAKTPAEYGMNYIENKYSEFRNRFFGGDSGPLPQKMEFKFNRSLKKLGAFKGTVSVIHTFSSSHYAVGKCYIELSNAYDFSPHQLDEVIIHEMVHAYFAYLEEEGFRENHGPRFLDKCKEINSASDYNITVENEDPLTLNQGMANRIANDGTIFMVGEHNENEYYVSRINQKDSGWYKSRLETWLKVPFVAYTCSDANFKSKFTVNRKKVSVAQYPRHFIDTLIADNIMKPCEIVQQSFAGTVLLSWKKNDVIAYAVCTKKYAPTVKTNLVLMRYDPVVYKVSDGFPGWYANPLNSGRIAYKDVDEATFNQWISDGYLTPTPNNLVESVTTVQPLVEMVVYKKGHKNSKGEAAPWTIVSHETGKILSSHKSKSAAEEHLRQMEYYKHKKAPQTEGIKDWALAGALALSPLGAVDADAAPTQKKEIVEVPVVKDYSTLEFQNNVQYKLTGDQYRKLRACNNLPADYIVPKAGKKVDTTKTAAKNEKKSDSSVVHDDIYDVGNKIGSKAKSAWNGIKSFGKGIMNGWNGTNESVGDFSHWINERPKTPVVEAVIKLYESSK